jgi:hypothetical protein
VAAGLAFTVLADGAPMFGADAGGALASVPAVATLLLARRGRLRWRALAAAFAAGVCAVGGLAAWEISRPAAQRTHLGRALTGGSPAQTLLRRGLSALGSFRSSPWLFVAVVAVVGLVALRRRLPTGAALRAGAAATGVAAVIGTVANDSGVAVGGAILFVAWAAALALAQPGGGAAVSVPAATAGSSR